jgi:TonB family protein
VLFEPPRIESPPSAQSETPLLAQRGVPTTPQIQPVEKPKLAFESLAQARKPNEGQGVGLPRPPSSSVAEAARELARSGGMGGFIVGDIGLGAGGLGGALNLPPAPGKTASTLELLSNPEGVDFRPYLITILSAVRRNWYAVIPESAKLGRRGRVVIQFAVSRDGYVPKLVIATPSGTDALDRAAVAGISASNPFPPLPAEFRGEQVRLQFVFLYNVKD